MNYEIIVNPEEDFIPYDRNIPYSWYIRKWDENECAWKEIESGNSESPNQAFQDAMECYNELTEEKEIVLPLTDYINKKGLFK